LSPNETAQPGGGGGGEWKKKEKRKKKKEKVDIKPLEKPGKEPRSAIFYSKRITLFTEIY
jgi:hypothetical protein